MATEQEMAELKQMIESLYKKDCGSADKFRPSSQRACRGSFWHHAERDKEMFSSV